MSPVRISLLVRSTLRIALCYIVAIQAVLAAYSTAFAVGAASETAASFAICHATGQDGSAGSSEGTGSPIPCAHCATMASGAALPSCANPIPAAPPSISRGLSLLPIAALVGLPPPRAGLARAPPLFV